METEYPSGALKNTPERAFSGPGPTLPSGRARRLFA